MGRIGGKVTAITGAGDGIGRASAELFAREGARVVILEIDERKGEEVQRSIRDSGGDGLFIRTDVSKSDDVRSAFERIRSEYGRLDVLYNNASIFVGKHDGPITELTEETWDRILAINLNGTFYCCKYGIALMMESGGGSAINTSSSAGVIGIPNCDAYTATKGATVSLTRSMAVEYAPRGVRVNCIAPAAIYTPMIRESNLDDPSFDENKFLNTTPVRRWGLPEDIANVALFLASDEASYLNGAIIVADGGITIT